VEQLFVILKTKFRILRNYLRFELNRTVKIELGIIITIFTLFILNNYSQNLKYSIPKHGIERALSELGIISLLLIASNVFVFISFLYRILSKPDECQLNLVIPIKPKIVLYSLLTITFLKTLFISVFALLLLSTFTLQTHIPFSNFLGLSWFIISGFIFASIAGGAFLISSLGSLIYRGKKQIKAFIFWLIISAVLILSVYRYSYFKEVFSPDVGKSLRGNIFWLASIVLFYIASKLWYDFIEIWPEWLARKTRLRQSKYRIQLNAINLTFGFLPSYIRPFIIKDMKLLSRRFRSILGIVVMSSFILIAINKHTTNPRTLGSSLVIVCLLSFYILSNSYFKTMEKGHEQMHLIKSLPVSPLRYWSSKFLMTFIPMLTLTGVAVLSLIVFKGWDHSLVLQLSGVILLIGLVLSFIQTNFTLAIFPFTNYMLYFYNIYIVVTIITFLLFNLISLVLIIGSFLIMKKALKNFQELEF